MKIQLDTTAKTIKIEESVQIDTLIKTLKKLLPNNEWKKFTLETHTIIHNWNSPTIIREYPSYPRYPWFTSGEGYKANIEDVPNMATTMELQGGTYNVEINKGDLS